MSAPELDETDLGATRTRPPSHAGSVEQLPDVEADLVWRGELGRGGMGVVRSAEQRSLRRDVAVKTATVASGPAAAALVREARIMGGLEHPNVVPVHALGVAPDGAPMLVMKRVEGVSWRALMKDATHEAWTPLLAGHGDRARAQLEILVQVCRALAFAHDRGVVHRDLKPDNVMIGRFGEVYLLDWGVALRVGDASEARGLVGTPAYLAPEMVGGDPKAVDARTDVYLLGANLYEVLTDRLPNAAADLRGALEVAARGNRPAVPATAPAELAQLAAAAMALDPNARPASAEQFRQALSRHLASREIDVLVRDGDAARARAEWARDTEGAASQTAYQALIEARFAFMSAARVRGDDARVRAGLEACLEQLVVREVALSSPVGARTHLSEMKSPPAALVAEVERIERRAEEAKRSAEAARRVRANLQVGLSVPTMVASAVALPVVAAVLWYWTFPTQAQATTSPGAIVISGAALFVAATALIFVARRRVLATLATRQLTAFFFCWGLAPTPFAIAQVLRGDPAFDYTASFSMGFVITSIGGLTLMTELWPCVAVHAIALGLVVRWPERGDHIGLALIALNVPIVIRALRARAQRQAALGSLPEGSGR